MKCNNKQLQSEYVENEVEVLNDDDMYYSMDAITQEWTELSLSYLFEFRN